MFCDNCQTRKERPCAYSARTREYARVLIPALRHVAHRYGFAIGVHGSLKTDIDLICVPWRDSAVGGARLAEDLRKTAEQIIGYCEARKYDKARLPEKKPCGRLAWSFYLQPEECGEGPYIDLSIMPLLDPPKDGE